MEVEGMDALRNVCVALFECKVGNVQEARSEAAQAICN